MKGRCGAVLRQIHASRYNYIGYRGGARELASHTRGREFIMRPSGRAQRARERERELIPPIYSRLEYNRRVNKSIRQLNRHTRRGVSRSLSTAREAALKARKLLPLPPPRFIFIRVCTTLLYYTIYTNTLSLSTLPRQEYRRILSNFCKKKKKEEIMCCVFARRRERVKKRLSDCRLSA